ncbi:MAG TPA: hypothetical protein VM537_25910 [Anaerolineae bacterium]|jgi:hypothetical protein|nr:hypothetical protein [Anaerolineae bacterium]HUW13186.1 hypothetical protein [Anaerolineae bacterium]
MTDGLAVEKEVEGEMIVFISSRLIISEVTPTDNHTSTQHQLDK